MTRTELIMPAAIEEAEEEAEEDEEEDEFVEGSIANTIQMAANNAT